MELMRFYLAASPLVIQFSIVRLSHASIYPGGATFGCGAMGSGFQLIGEVISTLSNHGAVL
jgi:hypothetical protein